MAIYWFSVARSLQWDEFVGRSPDFAGEVVKAKTEAEGIEKMTMRILSVAGAKSDAGALLPEPVTREEAAEWQKSAAKRNTEAGTLYPVCVDIREREPGKLTPILGRSVKQADMPGWWALSRVQVPDEPVPYYPETRRGMPIYEDKYRAGYGPAAQLLTEDGFLSRRVLLLRAVCGEAAREAARRIRLASEEGGPCLPRIAGILTVKEASLNMDKKGRPPADAILEDTPAWIWQEEQPLNLMKDQHYGNSWLIVDRDMCWIADRILGVARQMTVDALLSTLEGLAEAMDRYQPELERSAPALFKREAPEDGAEPLDKDREPEPFFREGGERWPCYFRWEASWEDPGNNYPCLVMPYPNPRNFGGRTGYDLKLVFPDAEKVSEFMRRLELAEPGRDKRVAVWIDMSGLCYGRAAKTKRRPVDNEPEHYYGGEVEKAFVETMGEWREKDRFHSLWDIRFVRPTSNIPPEPGSISFWLRNDGLLCILTHILFRPRRIMLEREPLMDALRELRERILEWDRPKDNNS